MSDTKNDMVVLHQGAIGDLLLAMSVVQAVRAYVGARQVAAIATAASAQVAAGRSDIDQYLCPESVGLYRLFRDDLPLTDTLTRLLCDARVVLSFLSGPNDAMHERLQRMTAGRVISIDPQPSPETRAMRTHITAQWTATARTQGLPIGEPTPPTIRLPKPSRAPLPRIIIHPGSGGRAKCWPIERFLTLADALAGADVRWMLGPAEGPLACRIEDRPEPVLIEPDLLKAAEHLVAADLYIGNDSGMTHLAAAVGVPVVAIFGATDPAFWRPLGTHVTVVAPADPDAAIEEVSLQQVRDALPALFLPAPIVAADAFKPTGSTATGGMSGLQCPFAGCIHTRREYQHPRGRCIHESVIACCCGCRCSHLCVVDDRFRSREQHCSTGLHRPV